MHAFGQSKNEFYSPNDKSSQEHQATEFGKEMAYNHLSAGTDLPEIKPATLLKMDNRVFIGQMKEQ